MDLIKYFNSITLKKVLEFISTSKEENLNLEFKTVNSSDFQNSDDRKNFAKALSGFANSDGGIIIWGIKTKKNKAGIEIAQEGKEISDLHLFLSKLNQLTGEYAKPLVDGVLHKSIKKSKNKGYVITLVPSSDSGPHMAMSGEKRYYKRSGDSFYQMEHYDIEDMFGRRKKPKLELSWKFAYAGQSGGGEGIIDNYRLVLGIRNIGRGLAKYPYFAISVLSPLKVSEYGVDGNRNYGLPIIAKNHKTGDNFVEFGSNNDTVIHPNTNLEIVYVKVDIPRNAKPNFDIEVLYKICSEDFSLFESVLFLKADEIQNIIKVK